MDTFTLAHTVQTIACWLSSSALTEHRTEFECTSLAHVEQGSRALKYFYNCVSHMGQLQQQVPTHSREARNIEPSTYGDFEHGLTDDANSCLYI